MSDTENTSRSRRKRVVHPRLVRLLTWLTGRKLGNTREDYKQGGMVCLRQYPAVVWEYAPTGDFYSLTLQVVAAPNVLHRVLQCLAFGVRYRLLPNARAMPPATESDHGK